MEFFSDEELSTEAKKDFRYNYLREYGIIAKVKEVLEKLMMAQAKPDNPLEFIRKELGASPVPAETIENMEHELDDAHREIRRLRGILKKLGINYTSEESGEIELGSTNYDITPNETYCSKTEKPL